MTSVLLRPKNPVYPDLTSVLQANDPSRAEAKMNNHAKNSCDPIVDHVMRSRAFKLVVWSFITALCAVGIAVISLNAKATRNRNVEFPDYRLVVLKYAGGPLVACVPVTAALVLPFSRRLR